MLFSARMRAVQPKGFTLIEIIIGIVVLAISLSIIGSLIAPTEQKSAEQILQVKAAELAQSLLNDINARAYDQNSDMAGGRIRCGEPDDGSNDCTPAADLGPESGENSRGSYNDVDDFHGYEAKLTANEQNLAQGYSNFTISVDVSYDGATLGVADNAAKRILVTITTPLGTPFEFASHKANF